MSAHRRATQRTALFEVRSPRIERLHSSVPGLDVVLGGGLLRRRGYLICGTPGLGKTVLALQYCFDVARAGENAVFVTLISESHATLLENLRTLSFCDESLVNKRVQIVSGYQALEDDGLAALGTLVRSIVREHRARLLVVDSVTPLLLRSTYAAEVPRFFRELTTYCSMLGCTALFVMSVDPGTRDSLVETEADGIVALSRCSVGLEALRVLEVPKLRGSAHLDGKHVMGLTSAGLTVHPRLEARYATPSPLTPRHDTRDPLGIEGLDEMLGGGLPASSSTTVFGGPGAGKTVLGLHFLAEGARRGEPALHFGFYEPPERLVAKGEALGLPLGRYARRGLFHSVWQPALEAGIDALAERLLEAVEQHQVRRLLVDGIDGFQTSAVFAPRMTRFFTALANQLRTMGVTTLFTESVDSLRSSIGSRGESGISAIADNLIQLRYVEHRGHFRRLVSIAKVRESGYDTSIREFRITEHGIELTRNPRRGG